MQIRQNIINDYKSNIAFGAGHITFYSDYDNTLMPKEFNHSVLGKKERPFDKKLFVQTFQPFHELIGRLGQNFEYIITSGRNYYEIKHNVDNIPEGVPFPMPKYFISANGADILEHSGKGFNYVFTDASKLKEEEVKKISNWDAQKARLIVSDILQRYGFEVIESRINNTSREYGTYSIESSLEALGKQYSIRFASIRKDENLHLNIAFPNSMQDETLFLKITQEIRASLEKTMKIDLLSEFGSSNGGIGHAGGYRLINISPNINGESLTKIFDPKSILKKAISSDDMVIVAGDSSNDKEMLNIFGYLDLSKYPDFPVKKWSQNSDKFAQEVRSAVEYLRKNHALRQEIDALPVISIIVDNDGKLNYLKEALSELNHDGITKFICVNPNNQTLSDAVEKAIKEYSKQNKNFANQLSIFKEKVMSKSSGWKKYVLIGAILAGILSLAYVLFNKYRKSKSE